MMTELRPVRSTATIQFAWASEEESVLSHLAGRLIQITLALYLLPALLAVLVVGVLGTFILKCSQLFLGPVKKSVD